MNGSIREFFFLKRHEFYTNLVEFLSLLHTQRFPSCALGAQYPLHDHFSMALLDAVKLVGWETMTGLSSEGGKYGETVGANAGESDNHTSMTKCMSAFCALALTKRAQCCRVMHY